LFALATVPAGPDEAWRTATYKFYELRDNLMISSSSDFSWFDERRPAMAGQDRMTIEEVVRRVLREEHGDVIRESVPAVAQEIMEADVSELIGAERGERGPEDRATHRNG
jgi:hypothetical protein